MTDRLKYGFEQGRLALEVPKLLLDTTISKFSEVEKLVSENDKTRTFDVGDLNDGYSVSLNAEKIGRTRDDFSKREKLQKFVKLLSAINSQKTDETRDLSLVVEMSVDVINGGDRYGMSAELAWPALKDEMLRGLTTTAMRAIAFDLHYDNRRMIPGLVYAQVDRAQGITLETNPIGSMSLDTDGMFYEPSQEVVKLYGHNIYNTEIQVICLSGLAALARAGDRQ